MFAITFLLIITQVLGIFQIDMWNVGNADTQIVKTSKGVIMIDFGYEDEKGPKNNFLKKIEGVKTVDLLVLTHLHEDHYNGIDLIADRINKGLSYPVVKQFLTYDMDIFKKKLPSKVLSKFEKWIDISKAISFTDKSAMKKLQKTYDGYIEFIEKVSPIDSYSNENDKSVQLVFINGDFIYVTFGDDSSKSENEVVKNQFKNVNGKIVDVSKTSLYHADHHGSTTSSSKSFLEAMKPTAVLISRSKKYVSDGTELYQTPIVSRCLEYSKAVLSTTAAFADRRKYPKNYY